MSDTVNCPYCGELIEADVHKCPHCEELFKEPELPGVKFKEFRIFFALTCLTLGLFPMIWILLNLNTINRLSYKDKDASKLVGVFLLLILNVIMALIFPELKIYMIVQILLYMFFTHRTLKIIQRYTKRIYNVEIDFNPYYILLFNVFYLVHFIDTYTDRVYHVHEFFDWRSPKAIALLIIIVVLIFMTRWAM